MLAWLFQRRKLHGFLRLFDFAVYHDLFVWSVWREDFLSLGPQSFQQVVDLCQSVQFIFLDLFLCLNLWLGPVKQILVGLLGRKIINERYTADELQPLDKCERRVSLLLLEIS
mgnify:CR=1 FL=1